jgi:hypothetical protein
MSSALVLPLLDSDAGPMLAAIRQVADEHSRSDPHVTVRYPIKRIDLHRLTSAQDAEFLSLEIVGAGHFTNRRGDRSVIYLECASDLLESYSYKPDFPDSIFHITLYEGPTTPFSSALLDLLHERGWNLALEFKQPTRFSRIDIGGRTPSHRRGTRFSEQTRAIVSSQFPNLCLDAMTDEERLLVIAALVDSLHKSLVHRSWSASEGPSVLESWRHPYEQPQLWVSAPIHLSRSSSDGYQLTPELARRGNLVLTTPELAEQIVSFSLSTFKPRGIHYGEPAFGSGIFFAVLNRLLARSRHQLESASAVEVNPDRATVAARRWSGKALRMLVGDFLTAEPVSGWNFVLANPPYIRSQDIADELKRDLAEHVQSSLGLHVSSRSNLYVYFVLLCHEWLVEDGLASWLLPADFLETNYGHVLREYLTTKVTLVRIHTFEPSESQFENVRVSSAVVVYRKAPPSAAHLVHVSRGGSLRDPAASSHVPVTALAASSSWRTLTQQGVRDRVGPLDVRLGEVFTVRRGIATGANSFFVLDEDRVTDLGLEKDWLVPVLPRPRYMPSDGVVLAEADGSPALTPRRYLIDSERDLASIKRSAPNLARYLAGAPDDVLNRHLVRKRSLFYRQEARAPAEIVASAMGQFDGTSAPVRFFLNQSRAVALNHYLCLYPKNERGLFGTDVATILFGVLCAVDPEEFRRCGREYAGGLFKLEPRGLSDIRLPIGRMQLEDIGLG